MSRKAADGQRQGYDVIIVGAGLAGLSCAYELASKGKNVIVFEAHSYVGGRTSSFVEDGMKVESGLHRYIGYYTALPRLMRKCGVSMKEMVTWEEKIDILVKQESKKMVLGLAPLLGMKKTVQGIFGNRDVLPARDKISLIPFFLCGFASYLAGEKLDRYTVAEYAEKHRVSERAKRLILETLSSGIFFLPPEKYSAYVFFGLFAPAISRFYKMRIGAYLGGMTEAMCEPIKEKVQSLGGVFCLGEPVKRVLTGNGNVVGVETEEGKKLYAGNTVIATTLPGAKKILMSIRDREELKKLFTLPEMSACSVQLELDQPALEKDITTFGPGTDLVSFAEQSRTTFRDSKGRLSVILGNPGEYVEKNTEEIVGAVTQQMRELGVPIDGSILDARKVAEGNDFYSLDKGNQHLRPEQKTGIGGLVLAGDYTRTASFATMEGAVLSGKKAAKACW